MKRVRHSVYGLNHLSWTGSVRVDPDEDGSGGEEMFPALLKDQNFIQSNHMSMFDPGLIEWQKCFLNEYLHYFNYDRAHTGRLTKGRVPGDIVLGPRKTSTVR